MHPSVRNDDPNSLCCNRQSCCQAKPGTADKKKRPGLGNISTGLSNQSLLRFRAFPLRGQLWTSPGSGCALLRITGSVFLHAGAPSTEPAGQHQAAVIAVAVIILVAVAADDVNDDADISVDGDTAVDAVGDDTIVDDDTTAGDDALIAITVMIPTVTAVATIISSPQASPLPHSPCPSLSPPRRSQRGRHPASFGGVSCHLPMLPGRQHHAASPRGGQRGPATVPGGPGRASPGAGLVPKSSPGVGMRGA